MVAEWDMINCRMKTNNRKIIIATFLLLMPLTMMGGRWNDSLEYRVEFQSTLSSGYTPLWLNANRHGLSSMEEENGYLRASLIRPLALDSLRNWGVGYGVDVALTHHFTSDWVMQQCYLEGRWLKGTLTIGSKNYPMELKNQELSSGSQTFGINARPIPQVRLALPDYWTIPLLNGWMQMKGYMSFGWMTDNQWQRDFTQCTTKYTQNTLYHAKAGYLRIGKAGKPLSVELGLEMAVTFGGCSYRPANDGTMIKEVNGSGLDSYWKAFIPGGSDVNESDYRNVMGNQLGSWLMRINYECSSWGLHVYADKYFEDHSSMFMLDYDGYGKGDEWNERKENRYFLYSLSDMMLGVELNLKRCRAVRNVVVEYLYTKYQSGPIYHDHTPSMSDHISGRDNYYNHGLFTGWQHWGQVMGNPLYRSPLYNKDGRIEVQNNRFVAWHFGASGALLPHVDYRLLATFQDGFGTYSNPYSRRQYNRSWLMELAWRIPTRKSGNWLLSGAYGIDRGGILGNNHGFQFTIAREGILSRHRSSPSR